MAVSERSLAALDACIQASRSPVSVAERDRLRSSRKHEARAATVVVTKDGALVNKGALADPEPRRLPLTRADCPEQRPCPHVSCKWHLYLDVRWTGNITVNFPDIEPDEMGASCTLDIAAEGGVPLERVGEAMNITRERVRQLEVSALEKLRASRRLPRW